LKVANITALQAHLPTVSLTVVLRLRLPNVPVMVIADFPAAAEPLTFSFNLLVDVAGFGLKAAVTPLGSPLALRVTTWSKVFAGLMVMVLTPLLPGATVKAAGAAASVKVPSGFTVRAMVVVAFRLPEVPVIVTVVFPVVAVPLAVRVRTLVLVAGFGLKEAVTPFGSPEAVRVTLPENLLTGIMVMVRVALAPPFAIVTVFGEVERLKLWLGVLTVRLSVVAFVNVPDLPVIVTVTVPTAAVALARKVMVLAAVAGLGLKDAVTPLGRPDAERVTLPLKLATGVMVMVLLPLLSCAMVTLLALAESVKSGAGQLFTRLKAFTVPIPVAKSQPVCVP